ncbi:MAG TPA: OmpA family protein [bacterium]|nr:OmpA family protein [bacterium]HPN31105.1 OmpA family protein [bacterium]
MKHKNFFIMLFIVNFFVCSCSFTPSYQKILTEKDSAIAELNNNVSQKKNEIEALQKKNSELDEELKKIKSDLQTEQTKLNETSKTLELANNQITVLKKDSENLYSNLESEKKIKSETEKQLNSASSELNSAKDKISNLNGEIKSKTEIISGLEKDAALLKKNIETSNIEIDKLKENIDALKNSNEKTKSDYESKLKIEIEKQKKLENDIITLNKKIDGLLKNAADSETKNNNVLKELETLKNNFEKFKNDSANRLKIIESEKETELKSLEKIKDDEANKLALELNKLKEELARMSGIEAAKKTLEEKAGALEKERDRIILELEKNKAEEISKLKNENNKIKEELEKLENKNEFLVKESQKGIEITFLDKILFDLGKADLKKQSTKTLNNVAKILNNYPNRNIVIEGHTDNKPIKTPKFPSNWELSADRALSVLKFFIASAKIPKDRISFQGFADTRPVADNASEDGRKLNRRVEIILLPRDLKIERVETK